jgi:hypothetical protein
VSRKTTRINYFDIVFKFSAPEEANMEHVGHPPVANNSRTHTIMCLEIAVMGHAPTTAGDKKDGVRKFPKLWPPTHKKNESADLR